MMVGSPGDPQGRLAAREHAELLAQMLDGAKVQEHANGVTVCSPPYTGKPDAFLHYAALPRELN